MEQKKCFGKRSKNMKETKFYRIGLGQGIVTIVLATVLAPVGALLFGCVSLYANLKKKESCRIRIGVALTILGMLMAISYLAFGIYIGVAFPNAHMDYWLFDLLF